MTDAREQNNTGPYIMCRRASNKLMTNYNERGRCHVHVTAFKIGETLFAFLDNVKLGVSNFRGGSRIRDRSVWVTDDPGGNQGQKAR